MLKLKKKNFTAIKVLFFIEVVDIKKISASNKISFDEEKHKYFISYLHNDDKVKPSHIILPNTSAYIKGYKGQTK